MVTTPSLKTLPFELHNGIKYFELTAEPVEQEILPGLFIKGWGYNGSIPGPTILVEPDDYVVIRVINYLPEPTSIHWHGLDIPNVMDGVLGGAFIILDPEEKACGDYFYMLQEFMLKGLQDGEVKPGAYEIDPHSMDFNFFTMNGRCFPFVDPTG